MAAIRSALVGGHSAGAQLAVILCTDDRCLKAEGVSFDVLLGCVPVDGDTYDVPAIIETAETRLRVHGFPPPTNGHRQKFGNTPENHKDFSAVTHIAKGKGIPPFLILHVADHPDTSVQAQRLGVVLKDAGILTTVFGAKDTNHSTLNDNLGLPEDPATAALSGKRAALRAHDDSIHADHRNRGHLDPKAVMSNDFRFGDSQRDSGFHRSEESHADEPVLADQIIQ